MISYKDATASFLQFPTGDGQFASVSFSSAIVHLEPQESLLLFIVNPSLSDDRLFLKILEHFLTNILGADFSHDDSKSSVTYFLT